MKRVCRFRAGGDFSVVCALAVPLAITIAVCSTVTAASQPASEPVKPKLKDTPPPWLRTGDFDWIQLKSGEWLKGEIKDLQDKSLSFESDELDTLQFDWDDVYAVYSPKQNTCVFEDNTSVLGSVRIEGNDVTVVTPADEKRYDRANLRSIIPGGVTEWDYWSLKYSLGVTIRQGNADQTDISSNLQIQRRSPGMRTQFDLTGTYGSFEGEETTDNQLALLRHDVFLTRQLYLTVPQIQYYRDDFKNISERLTPGIGLGYEIIDRGDVEWRVAGGGGYQWLEFDEVEPGEDSSVEGAVFLAGSDLTWELTEKLEFELHYSMTSGLGSVLATSHHALATLSFDVWKDLELDVSLQWDRVGSPQREPDGDKPDEDDVRLFVGIGLEL